MSWAKGFNFRSTEAFAADGVDETYVIQSDAYPTTRNGVTFGQEDAFIYEHDRLVTNDRRLVGLLGDFTPGPRFRVDLPSAGDYNIRMAMGDALFEETLHWVTKDDTTLLDDYSAVVPANEFLDASGVIRTATIWITSNEAVNRTFATNIFRLVVGTGTGGTVIAHLRIELGLASISPSCLVSAYREIVFDPDSGMVTMGFAMQVYIPDGTGRPQNNPDSASVTFDSTQAWSVTKAAIHSAVIARALEFGIALTASNIIINLPPIERG